MSHKCQGSSGWPEGRAPRNAHILGVTMPTTQNATYIVTRGAKPCPPDIMRTAWKTNVWDRLRQVEADVEQSVSKLDWTITDTGHERQIHIPASSPTSKPDVLALVTKIYEF